MKNDLSKFDKDVLLTLLDQSQNDNEKLRQLVEQQTNAIQSLQAQFNKLQSMLFGQSSERQRSLQKKTDDPPENKKSNLRQTKKRRLK